MFFGPFLTAGHRLNGLASFLPVCCTLLCVTLQLSKKMASIWEQVLSFRHLGGRSKVFPVFCLLKITGLKYQKVIFLGGNLCSPLFPLLNIVFVFMLLHVAIVCSESLNFQANRDDKDSFIRPLSFIIKGNWGPKEICNLPEFTKLVNSRDAIRSQAFPSPAQCSYLKCLWY